MSKKILLLIIIFFIGNKEYVFAQSLEKGTNTFGAGLNSGIVIGEFDNQYRTNLGIDLFYLYGISDKLSIGITTGFTNYFGEETNISGLTTTVSDIQYIPVASTFRFSPIKNLLFGADIGFAISLNEQNDSGFYASPRITYLFNKKFPFFLGYRLIDLNGDNLDAIQLGIGYKF